MLHDCPVQNVVCTLKLYVGSNSEQIYAKCIYLNLLKKIMLNQS